MKEPYFLAFFTDGQDPETSSDEWIVYGDEICHFLMEILNHQSETSLFSLFLAPEKDNIPDGNFHHPGSKNKDEMEQSILKKHNGNSARVRYKVLLF